ncbi:MAG TPA: serine protease [Kofleriaceae bacterium]|nr:serine protease [Kofleriaceae bacterium]
MMMKRAFALGLVAIPACTAGSSGTASVDQSIIGGTTTQTADWKSVVALEDNPGDWFCTGTLITDQWVLTAAHCMEGETPAKLHVRFDTNDANNGTNGHAVAVAEIHSNPAFNFDAWDNDVALIKLAAPVTDRTPTPINRDAIAFGSQVVDVGYGVSDNNDGGGGILRKVSKVTADCAGANDTGIVNDNLVCMDASDGRGSCFGDSGGPTFVTVGGALQVAGVTSGGTGDACGAGWDLYTSVHGELAFIDMIMSAPSDPGGGDGSGSGEGSGSGSGSGMDTNDPSNPGNGEDGGCSAAGGGSSSALLVFALAAVIRRRRRATDAKPAE